MNSLQTFSFLYTLNCSSFDGVCVNSVPTVALYAQTVMSNTTCQIPDGLGSEFLEEQLNSPGALLAKWCKGVGLVRRLS